MAEAFGIAVGVVQIIDAVSKLKDLWNNVKNAPDDLVDCVHDIQRTARLLDKSKQLLSGSVGVSDDHLTECSQDLESALTAVRNTTSDLQRGLRHYERLGALKIVLKKDEIARGRRKLERAQSLLSTAQQNLALTLQLQHTSMLNQNNALLYQIYSIVQTTAQNAPVDPNAPRISKPGAELTVHDNASATRLANCSSRSTSRRLREINSSYSIRFPLWLTRRCFEIVRHREMSLLQFTFTSYNVVDINSPGHLAVRCGDLERLKKLLETGKATPFDQSYNGTTLLQDAFTSKRLHIAQFLIDRYPSLAYKIDHLVMRYSFNSWTVLEDETDLAKYCQMWDFVTKYADIDQDMLYEVEQYFRAHGMPGTWAEWLPLIPKAASTGMNVLPREARMWLASRTTAFDLFKDLTGANISTREVLELTLVDEHHHVWLLYRILGLPLRDDMNELLRWSAVVRDIFEFDKRQGSAFRWPMYTLDHFLNNAVSKDWWVDEPLKFSSLPELWNHALQKRIQYLEDMGVDLVHYGQRETRAMNDSDIEQYGQWRGLLCYGPRAVDWKFCFIPCDTEYEWAGQFWNWIETPELFLVPGSFPMDETDGSQDDRRARRYRSDWRHEQDRAREREARFHEARKQRRQEKRVSRPNKSRR